MVTDEKLKLILENKIPYATGALKVILWKRKIKPMHCEECKWSKYSEDGRLPLELEHIDGNNKNNNLSNLKILCPNCHSLTSTYCGCNVKEKSSKSFYRNEFGTKILVRDKKTIDKRSLRALTKNEVLQRIDLIKSIDASKHGWIEEASEKLGISHTSVKRFMKKYCDDIQFFERKKRI